MIFLALKTEDGRITGKISFYCRMLGISRQGFYKYLVNKDRPWKYQDLADTMKEIVSEDECNDTYGRIRMYQALLLKQPEGVHIPSERTVYRVMDQIGLSHLIQGIVQKRFEQSKTGYLFEYEGKKVSESKYREILADLTGKLQMEHTPHECRHTFGSRLDSAGANKVCIDRIMGHKSKGTGERVYTHKNLSLIHI